MLCLCIVFVRSAAPLGRTCATPLSTPLLKNTQKQPSPGWSNVNELAPKQLARFAAADAPPRCYLKELSLHAYA